MPARTGGSALALAIGAMAATMAIRSVERRMSLYLPGTI
jgi:hypothetical protein